MRILKTFVLLTTLSVILHSCKDDDDKVMIDTEKPSIDLKVTGAFPISCDTLYFDEPFTIKLLLTDNVELGSYNIDIHNNFDQHTHSTELEVCTLDEIKTPINSYIFIQDYNIPSEKDSYTTDLSMTIPSSDGADLYDEGDYHFQTRVTDKEGWSNMVGLNIKILRR